MAIDCTSTCYADALVAMQIVIDDPTNKIGIAASEEYVNKIFKEYAFTNQERGAVLAKMLEIQATQQGTLLIDGAVKMVQVSADVALKDQQILGLEEELKLTTAKIQTEYKRMANLTAQASLVFRQQKNYDDALQKKVTETAGSYANYAIISDPEGAQPPLDQFKREMQNLKNRITQRGIIPNPTMSTNGLGHLVETFVVDALTVTIEHRDDPDNDYVVAHGASNWTYSTYEDALLKLMDELQL